MTALVGLLCVNAAFVVWLTELLGALHWALLLVAIVNIAVAVVIYIVALRDMVRLWQQRMDTIYEVSATLENLYRHLVETIKRVWAALS